MTTSSNPPPAWDAAAELVKNAESILVVTHIQPDGDAFGSMLGLTNALIAMGKSVDCAVDDGLQDFMAFLPGAERIQGELTSGQWDVMVSVDSSDEDRTGSAGAYGREHADKVINLDHHATNIYFGDVYLVDPVAVSATEIVFRWLQGMNLEMTREVAMPLLTGLVTDTLGFRTSNVTSATLGIAQQLMASGASLTEITERVLDNRSYNVAQLWRYALDTMKLHDHGIVAAEVTVEALNKSGIPDVTDGGLVGFLVKINEAMIAIVFKENRDGTIGISMRSKPGFDVSAVAFELGGGGHKQAAGATIPGPLKDAQKRVIPLLKKAAQKGKLTIA